MKVFDMLGFEASGYGIYFYNDFRGLSGAPFIFLEDTTPENFPVVGGINDQFEVGEELEVFSGEILSAFRETYLGTAMIDGVEIVVTQIASVDRNTCQEIVSTYFSSPKGVDPTALTWPETLS